jgi:cytochrome c biogenesis protein CcmG/thiol:disulfide interchange protein DsbE
VDLITVRDPDESAAKLYHTDMWPETYVIDRKGVIRRKFVGAQDWSSPEIRAFLNGL